MAESKEEYHKIIGIGRFSRNGMNFLNDAVGITFNQEEKMEIAKLPCTEIDLYDGRKLTIRKSKDNSGYSCILTIVDPGKGNEDYFFLEDKYDGRSHEVPETKEEGE